MPFLSPGAAAASALEDFMVKREVDARQARLDAQAAETHRSNMERAKRLLEREDLETKLKLEDRERSKTEKEVEGMIIGDIPTEDLTVRARKHGIPMRTAVQPPAPAEVEAPGLITELSPDGASGETPVAELPAGNIRFAGSPAQVKEEQARAAQQKFIQGLKTMPALKQGETGAAMSAAARAAGLNMPASDFEPAAPPTKSATIQEWEQYKADETAAGRKPLGFDAYQARDANRKRSASRDGLTDAQVASSFNTLAGKYQTSPLTKAADRTLILSDAVRAIRKDPKNAVEQQNLGYAFVQIEDTYQSAVREGELKNLAGLGSAAGRLKATVEKFLDGTGNMPPEIALQIAATAERMAESIKDGRKRKLKEFTVQAETAGIGPSWNKYVKGLEALDEPEAPAAGGGGGIPKVGDTFMGGKVISVD